MCSLSSVEHRCYKVCSMTMECALLLWNVFSMQYGASLLQGWTYHTGEHHSTKPSYQGRSGGEGEGDVGGGGGCWSRKRIRRGGGEAEILSVCYKGVCPCVSGRVLCVCMPAGVCVSVCLRVSVCLYACECLYAYMPASVCMPACLRVSVCLPHAAVASLHPSAA